MPENENNNSDLIAKRDNSGLVNKTELPKEQNQDRESSEISETKAKNFSIEAASYFSGPLPPPQIIQGYEDACLGAADRLIKMVEEQGQHRRQYENKILHYDISRDRRGQWFALIISLTFLAGGVLCVLKGYPKSGAFIVGSTLVSLVSMFLLGEKKGLLKKKRKEPHISGEESETPQTSDKETK